MTTRLAAIVGAALLTGSAAFAQIQSRPPASITVVGCLQRESGFVLVHASRDSSAWTDLDCSNATGSETFELTGIGEDDLKDMVGRRIEIAGVLKRAAIEKSGPVATDGAIDESHPDAVGTSGTTESRPTGGFDPLNRDLRLFEIDVTSFGEFPGDARGDFD